MTQDEIIILRNGKTMTPEELAVWVADLLKKQGYIISLPTTPQPEDPSTGPVVVIPTPEPDRLMAKLMAPLLLQVNVPVSYPIPATAFSGPVENVDVSDLPAGLRYDSSKRTIYGTPQVVDTRILRVTATGAGQMAQTDLRLTVMDVGVTEPVKPDTKPPTPTLPETPVTTDLTDQSGEAPDNFYQANN